MSDAIEFDPVDRITAGAVGTPGSRVFLIQAEQGGANLTVLVEKEQVAILAARLLQLLAQLAEYLPEADEDDVVEGAPPIDADPEPLFRARMMRLGFDTGRDMVVLELFEDAAEAGDSELGDLEDPDYEPEGHVARFFATRAQMRAVAARGTEAVAGGRPACRLCMLPVDPGGHDCPSKN